MLLRACCLGYSKIVFHCQWQMVWLHVCMHVYAQGISACQCICRHAHVCARRCVRRWVCFCVRACARALAGVRACELVFVEFFGDRDRQPAAATAETALRTSESPDGLASMGSLPPPSLLYPTGLVFEVTETVTVSLQPSCLPAFASSCL